MLDMESIKELLAWVDEEGLNGYTWDIRDTYRQYRDLVAEVERLRAPLARESAQVCGCYESGVWCRPCWAHYVLTGEDRASASSTLSSDPPP